MTTRSSSLNAPQKKTEPGTAAHKDVFNVSGVLLEFLASPEEVKDSICFIRGMMPPGIVVPLHRHEEPELMYVLEGSLEVYRSDGPSGGWMAARTGDIVVIPSNVKHALRNGSSVPTTLALVTKSELYAFFRELAKPFDPDQRPESPTPEAMQELFELAAMHGYWMASPEENAAIGISL
jgi:quercetin dioxygenase-like cupin family protein